MNDDPSDNAPKHLAVDRRRALVTMLELGLATTGLVLFRPRRGEAHPVPSPRPVTQSSMITLGVEHPGGGDFPVHAHGGELWVAGSQGARYDLTLDNHTNERLEVVVTVDGRDVISGKLGDYKKQRGYVLDPWGSLRIEGYRQSFDRVAAFRFSELADSYSARLGTPAHVGVIGAAVFREKQPKKRRNKNPLAPSVGDPFPGTNKKWKKKQPKPKQRGRAPLTLDSGAAVDDWAVPEASNEIGTEYGESVFAPVEEVAFKRRKNKTPDQLLVMRYDSPAGLQRRGISGGDPTWREPEPTWTEPDRRFAPPPPRRWR